MSKILRIGLDVRLNAYRQGGISTYTFHLLNALAPLLSHEKLLTLQHWKHSQPLLLAPNVQRLPLFTPPHHRWEQWTIPLETLPMGLDLLHFPDFIAPKYCPYPTVVTIHDLAFLRFPDLLDTAASRYYRQVKESVRNAKGVIAVSQATRRDISNLLDLPAEKVDLVYEAAAPTFRPLTLKPGEVRSLPQLKGETTTLKAGTFALFVSTLEPRKNLPTLLQALRICKDRQPGENYHLVVAGGRGWREEAIFETLIDLRLTEDVTFLGSVSPTDLLWLYNACRIYVNPSLYEGFGLPALEALACGAATLVSDGGSLPELVGEAALIISALDIGAWAEALAKVWGDEGKRQDLQQRGTKRAALFTWERAARETIQIYQRVVRQGS